MTMHKPLVIGLIVLMLGAQFAAEVPPGGLVPRSHRFWPFVNYPMYATPRYAWDVFRVPTVEVTRCDGGVELVPAKMLRISRIHYQETLWRILDAPSDSSDRALISHLVTTRVGADACRIGIRVRGYLMGPDGWNPAMDPPERVVISWELARP
jgi:hypothetical protein